VPITTEPMYGALRRRSAFACPQQGATHVRLSSFRVLEQLPGTAHPVVYTVRFACRCGDEHQGLVAHDELDYAPLGLGEGVFLNILTARMDDVASELCELADRRIPPCSLWWRLLFTS